MALQFFFLIFDPLVPVAFQGGHLVSAPKKDWESY